MPRKESAVIEFGIAGQDERFWDWVEQNRSSTVGISADQGCGRCVNIYYLVVDDSCPANPCPGSGAFRDDTVRYGAERDAVIDEHI